MDTPNGNVNKKKILNSTKILSILKLKKGSNKIKKNIAALSTVDILT
jgi:hypothetical protein